MLKFKIYFLEILKKLNFKNDGVHLLYICPPGECQVNVKSQSELDIGGRETCLILNRYLQLWDL